ncbi:MAG: hypothetical protein JNL60_03620, partial [Bacteroidia bacterium]|nr:hypothetical protein [Bacteroidia bacterium]
FEEIITTDFGTFLIESHSYQISSNQGINSYERELLVSKFDDSGKMEWMKIIPKFTANGLNEFNYLVKNRKIYFFYAEHPKNLEKTTITDYNPKKYQPIKNYNGSFLVCTSLDEKGSLERKEVFRNKGWCYDPSATNIVLDNGKTLLLRMINDESERYDKISLGN